MFKRNIGLFFQNDSSGGGNGASGAGDENGGGGETLTFESFIASQPENVKALVETHTQGLKSALDSERGTRKDLEKQVRDLAAKAEKGSESEKQLTTLANNLAESDRKADFYDAAHKAGVSNLKLAYITATTEELFDKKGNVDFVEMKTKFPELFGKKKNPDGSAGDGTETIPANGTDLMNQRIRQKAGR